MNGNLCLWMENKNKKSIKIFALDLHFTWHWSPPGLSFILFKHVSWADDNRDGEDVNTNNNSNKEEEEEAKIPIANLAIGQLKPNRLSALIETAQPTETLIHIFSPIIIY